MAETEVRQATFAGRPVWLLAGDRAAHDATWHGLDAGYDGSGPCGLLTRLDPPDAAAEWAGPRTLFAGHAPDGRQLRIAWFSAAVTREMDGWPLIDPPFAIFPFAGQDAVTAADLIALWTGEGVLSEAEARRRVDEVLLVAIDGAGCLIGVSTRFLHHSPLLGLEVWNVRVFVAASARKSALATALSVAARDHLETAYVSGGDTRSGVFLMEIQNAFLQRAFFEPVWRQVQIVLIGETPNGYPARVHYFAGATVPLRA